MYLRIPPFVGMLFMTFGLILSLFGLGHSFYGDPGLFRLDHSALNIAIGLTIGIFGLLILVHVISGLGATFSLLKALFKRYLAGSSTSGSGTRSLFNSPEVTELASLVLTSLEKFYNLEAES